MIKGHKKPLVSVVITDCSYGEYICEASEGVPGEAYDNIELIIDDGSTDNSRNVIDGYASDKNDIRIVYLENMVPMNYINSVINELDDGWKSYLSRDLIFNTNPIRGNSGFSVKV